MRDYQIISDSACDLPASLVEKHDIRIISFYVSFDQDIYYKENVDITKEAFYERLAQADNVVTTSLPSVQEYINIFKATLREGKDVLCICLSQQFSGSYQSAMNAKTILEEQYPDAQICVVDSLQATAGQGLLLLQAAYLKECNYPIGVVDEKLNKLKATSRIMFTVDTLRYLKRGRRIGKLIALMAGDALDVKPLVQLADGELIPYSKVRGRKNSLDMLFSMTEEYFKDTKEDPKDYDFCITDATTPEDAVYLQKQIETLIGRRLHDPIFQIGVTIGTYAGPGGIGICFIKKFNCI